MTTASVSSISINDLPTELLLLTLNHLDFEEQLVASGANRSFRSGFRASSKATELFGLLRIRLTATITPCDKLEKSGNRIWHAFTNDVFRVFFEEETSADGSYLQTGPSGLLVIDRKSNQSYAIPGMITDTEGKTQRIISPHPDYISYGRDKQFITTTPDGLFNLWQISDTEKKIEAIWTVNLFENVDLNGVEQPLISPRLGFASCDGKEFLFTITDRAGPNYYACLNKEGRLQLLPNKEPTWHQGPHYKYTGIADNPHFPKGGQDASYPQCKNFVVKVEGQELQIWNARHKNYMHSVQLAKCRNQQLPWRWPRAAWSGSAPELDDSPAIAF